MKLFLIFTLIGALQRHHVTGRVSYYYHSTQFNELIKVYTDFFRKKSPKSLCLQSVNKNTTLPQVDDGDVTECKKEMFEEFIADFGLQVPENERNLKFRVFWAEIQRCLSKNKQAHYPLVKNYHLDVRISAIINLVIIKILYYILRNNACATSPVVLILEMKFRENFLFQRFYKLMKQVWEKN